MMISKIRQAFAVSQAVSRYISAMQKNDFVSAKRNYSVFKDSARPRHIAMGGRLALAESDVDLAKDLLEKAADFASDAKGRHNKYVLEYCRFYLSLINKDGRHEEHRKNALGLRPIKSLYHALPLAPKD